MLRKLACLLAILATTLGLTVFSTGTASAIGQETFGCRIAPGNEFNFYQTCRNTRNSNTYYSVAFKVQNATASSTFSWTIPAFYQSRIISGCTSMSSGCTLSAPPVYEQEIHVDVWISDGGASRFLNSSAYLVEVCGYPDYCW
ncbi:MAG TPA: hypothetical protein VF557_08480 [Jatrophihabitans sp.]|jgi:hypothetical protein|uniref:hypothetical protein n=1 Tax=Jatrophihabitans sp. TaxID=1932789 RepID=UPI002F0F254E